MAAKWTIPIAGPSRRVAGFVVAALVWALAGLRICAAAGESPEDESAGAAERFRPFLERHCYECHRGEMPKGELRLDRLKADFADADGRKQATQHFAGRWAAKEAILKTLGAGWRKGISWRDIEVRNDQSGRPIVGLRGGARDIVEQRGIREMLVSISHCRSHATAYALALGGEVPPQPDETEAL
ncbi:MAG TPA: holo-ACP synthase [Pirellulales bacterium]|nr:holo-ACP synthase [Pirellulales bacterium]